MAVAPISVTQAALPEIARRGVAVPAYDRSRLAPRVVHIGVGGFHRAHLAVYLDDLAAAGGDWGVTGLGLLEQDAAMAAALGAQDHLYTLIERGAGEPRARVVGSLIGYVHAPAPGDPAADSLIASPDTRILSLTVTESGYEESGEPTTFDRIAAGLAQRRAGQAGPLTILSCDNLPANGAAAKRATLAAARRHNGALAAWVEEQCTFPDSMVDRITPVTADADRGWLRDAAGVEDRWPVVAEPFRQWVLADEFAAGRPPFEDAGALVGADVDAWEVYKLRFLNAGHSCMAYLCALAGLELVHEAMAVPAVRAFLEGLLCEEAVPTVAPIAGHAREDYVATVLERFANPGVRDQVARLCIDGTAKFPTFLVPTLLGQLAGAGRVERAATALAGWARYLATVDEDAQAVDSSGARARECARAALSDPLAFLELETVFGPELRDSERFRSAFRAGYRAVAQDGPIAAMERAAGGDRAGDPR